MVQKIGLAHFRAWTKERGAGSASQNFGHLLQNESDVYAPNSSNNVLVLYMSIFLQRFWYDFPRCFTIK